MSYVYIDIKRFNPARQMFFKILELDTNDLGGYYQLGKIAVLSGEGLLDGLLYFDKFLTRPPGPDDPTWAAAHWRKGMIQQKLGNKTQAHTEYQEALRLNPKLEDAKKALEGLE